VPRVGSGVCTISPPRFLAEGREKRLNLASFILLCFVLFAFYPRRYASAGYRDRNVSVRPSVRLSVRPSRAGIVSKRRKLAS